MARILSFGHEPNEVSEKSEKPGIKDYFWSLINSLDRFTISQIIFVILIVIITPIITATSIILISRASTKAEIGSALSNSPSNIKSKDVGVVSTNTVSVETATITAPTTYLVDNYVYNELILINNWRVTNNLPPLYTTYKLTNTAKWMAENQANYKYMAHYDSNCISTSCSTSYNSLCQAQVSCGRPFSPRLGANGYINTYTWSGENLGVANIDDAAFIFGLWKNSAGHNANMLGNKYNAIGIYKKVDANNYNWYWAVEFGTLADTSGNVLDTKVSYITSLPSPIPLVSPSVIPTTMPTLTPIPTPTTSPTTCTSTHCGGTAYYKCTGTTNNCEQYTYRCSGTSCVAGAHAGGQAQSYCCGRGRTCGSGKCVTSPATTACTTANCGGTAYYKCTGTSNNCEIYTYRCSNGSCVAGAHAGGQAQSYCCGRGRTCGSGVCH